MKARHIITALALSASAVCLAQSADARIGEIINRADWFALEEEYPALKDSMQADFLKLMAEMMTGYCFNRPDDAIRSIDELLMHHQQDLGSENALNIAQLKCHIAGLGGKFDYAAAAMTAKDVADRLETQEAESDLYRRFEDTYRFYDKFRDIPAPKITRPDRDVTVPIEIERVKLPTHIESKGWRGTTIYVPVTANGKTYRFIFDTEAGTSFVSESMAEALGIRAIADSVAVNANMPGTMFGKMGTTDSLQIGEMTLHNPLFTIAPPNALDSVLTVDAVLGMDFISCLDELRIYPKEKKMVFPAASTPPPAYGSNLMNEGGSMKLRAEAYGEKLTFYFDTGNSTAALSHDYYAKHKDRLDRIGTKEHITGGGFNIVRTKEVLRLPEFKLSVGDAEITLKDIPAETTDDGIQTSHDGNIGMSLVEQCDCVTINMKDMFLKLD